MVLESDNYPKIGQSILARATAKQTFQKVLRRNLHTAFQNTLKINNNYPTKSKILKFLHR